MSKQIIIACIILLAIVVRFWGLGSNPVSLYWDEVAILLDAKSISQTGMDMHGLPWYQVIFPSYGDYKLPVYIWFTSIFVSFFGTQEWVVRLPSAIAGTLTILVGGYIAWAVAIRTNSKHFASLVGIATLAVLAFSPWGIMFSRTGFEAHLAQFFVALSVATLITSKNYIAKKHTQKISHVLFIVSIILGVTAIYTYFSVRFVWPFVWGSSVIFFYFDSINTKHVVGLLGRLVIGGVLTTLLLLPMYNSDKYQISNQFRLSSASVLTQYDYPIESNILREQSGNTILSRIFYHRRWLMTRELLQNVSEHASPIFLFVSGDKNLRHGTGMHGLFVLPLFLPAIVGLFALGKKNPLVLIWLGIWVGFAFVPASVPLEVPHALRSINAFVPLAIIIGWGIAVLIEHVQLSQRKIDKIALGIFAALTLVFTCQFLFHYFFSYPIQSTKEWQAGYDQEAKIYTSQIRTDSSEFIQISHHDDRLYLWILLEGNISPTYIQSLETDGYKPKKIYNLQVSK